MKRSVADWVGIRGCDSLIVEMTCMWSDEDLSSHSIDTYSLPPLSDMLTSERRREM